MDVTEALPAPARVVFADDDAVLRELLGALLGFLPHVTVVGEASDGIEAGTRSMSSPLRARSRDERLSPMLSIFGPPMELCDRSR